jgi:hypothetical protein
VFVGPSLIVLQGKITPVLLIEPPTAPFLKHQQPELVLQQEAAPPPFQIIVLTMNREKSLKRLLKSLQTADYDGDVVDLVIRVDYYDGKQQQGNAANKNVMRVAHNISWIHGNKTIHLAKENRGLAMSWFAAWYPTKTGEHAMIFEDDLQVSPAWYLFCKQAWNVYSQARDLAGVTLTRQTFVPQLLNSTTNNKRKPRLVKQVQIENDFQPFLYRLPGSHGFSPHPSVWRGFIDWVNVTATDPFARNLSTPHLITWHNWNGMSLRVHRTMWTQFFI